jgi:hypothetical protein
VGILLALVGVAVLAVAIIALHNPKSTGSDAAGGSSTAVTPPTTATTGSTSTRSTPSSGKVTAPATSRSSSPSDSTANPTQNSSEALAAAQAVPLVVLNNTTITGLAAQAATRFEDGGWTVTSEGNLTNNILSTCAYYDPTVSGAKKAAKALQAQYPTIKRVEPKFDELPAGPVVVVLTPDYSAG